MITAAVAREVSACLVIVRLLAIGIRGARLTGLAIRVAAVAWTGLISGCVAWLSISLWSWSWAGSFAIGAVLPIPETAAFRREA
jgi:hypothetical protein